MNYKKIYYIINIFFIIIITILYNKNSQTNNNSYAVLIGVDDKNILPRANGYKTVVLDAQIISKKSINQLKDNGITVFSYLSIGSLENYRPYYEKFNSLELSPYENWKDEYWLDVSDKKWQKYMGKLAKIYEDNGVDGIFLDNTDIYEHFPKKEIYKGLIDILTEINKTELKIIINGGDIFVDKLLLSDNSSLIDGINQECVFTNIINYDKDVFSIKSGQDNKYFTDYLDRVNNAKKEIYIIEYTKNASIKKNIEQYCTEHNYKYYISESLKLK